MKVSFIKQMKNLEREVLLKSVELDDDGDDFQFELDDFSTQEEIIAVAPKCVRCNTCVGECPVNAIVPANIFRLAKITDKCVKCEICVQTCPVSAIKLIKNVVTYNADDENDFIDGISIFQMIPYGRISKSARRIKEARHGAKQRRRTAKSYRRIDILFVRNQRKSTSDIDIEKQPNADKFHVRKNFKTAKEGFNIKLLVFFHPAFGLFQK